VRSQLLFGHLRHAHSFSVSAARGPGNPLWFLQVPPLHAHVVVVVVSLACATVLVPTKPTARSGSGSNPAVCTHVPFVFLGGEKVFCLVLVTAGWGGREGVAVGQQHASERLTGHGPVKFAMPDCQTIA
jgi:hypothetical protein